ncbi:MAG: hypothetical protein B6229_10265 [Spirochaetaceae bacterium 4572_7]|nr:MAG: hypothetical protein B6229_10265 [Spirochaetaceae bacterium 4572_7]
MNTSGYVTIVGTGATTITATKAGDDNYNSITDSYILTVERPFITTWDFVGAAGSYSVTIPTRSNWAYDCYIDWGDNSVEHYTRNSGLSTNPSHEYTIGNEKIIKIYGTFPAIYFGSAGSTDIKSIDQWGDVVWEDFYSAFSGCTNLQMKATDIPIITNNI